MQRAIVTIVVALGAGCGGSQRPAPAGASCDDVAGHMVVLAERDNQAAAGEGLAAGMRGELGRQCQDEPWSAARRQCLLAASSQDATLACPTE